MARSGIHLTEDTLSPRLAAFPGKINQALDGIMQYHEPQVARYMKDNAPWTDRTANARNGLDAKAYSDQNVHGIVAFHQVPYGIWLEVSNSGKYRIIVPTIISQGQEVMRTVRDVFRRMD